MAKYEDYVKDIEGEIDEAQAASNQRARDAATGRFIPDRFKGKSAEEIAQSYIELEKLNSRQAQDLGAMRKTVDQLLDIQKQQASSPIQDTSKPVSVDDLYEDADGVLRRVAKEEVSGEISEIRQELNQLRLERKLAQLDNKFPDWQNKVQDEDFNAWVQESPYRQRMYQDADSGNFDAAEEILGMYYERSSSTEHEEEVQQKQETYRRNLNDAMLESSSPVAPQTEDVFSRSDLMEARLAAKRGDLKAERWLQAHSDSIARAYEEGRIVD